MKMLKALIVSCVLFSAYVFIARLLFPLPDISDRVAENSTPADTTTQLGQWMLGNQIEHVDKSGVTQLQNGHDALASRLSLINAAQQSIDSQYYIWHDDPSGIMLLDALYKAAQRGVRVRLLLDDNGIHGMDELLAPLNAMDGFEVRLFNPSTVRRPKWLGYSFDFFRMNRRMHNKSLIVDGSATIIGGRNIGDEYFAIGEQTAFVDMDILATGVIVREVADVFDQYWNSQSVYELEKIIGSTSDVNTFNDRVAEIDSSPLLTTFKPSEQDFLNEYLQNDSVIEWTEVELVADDPAKGLGQATADQLMITQLGDILGGVSSRLDLVSAYFVPGNKGAKFFQELSRADVDIRVLTNAMYTTDVFLVHAGYARTRRELLEADIELFELKLGSEPPTQLSQVFPFGLSGASLHAKTFSVDNERVFVGSFNFDPRSALLNCEMGFLIDSPTMAQKLSSLFDGPMREASYIPALTPNGKMIWKEKLTNGETLIYQEEPEATWFSQIAISIVGLLPVEWLL